MKGQAAIAEQLPVALCYPWTSMRVYKVIKSMSKWRCSYGHSSLPIPPSAWESIQEVCGFALWSLPWSCWRSPRTKRPSNSSGKGRSPILTKKRGEDVPECHEESPAPIQNKTFKGNKQTNKGLDPKISHILWCQLLGVPCGDMRTHPTQQQRRPFDRLEQSVTDRYENSETYSPPWSRSLKLQQHAVSQTSLQTMNALNPSEILQTKVLSSSPTSWF